MAKIVRLSAPTTIGHKVQTPLDGPLIVSAEEAAFLAEHELLNGEAEDLPGLILENPVSTATSKAKRG